MYVLELGAKPVKRVAPKAQPVGLTRYASERGGRADRLCVDDGGVRQAAAIARDPRRVIERPKGAAG
jgi:hypothetical protein